MRLYSSPKPLLPSTWMLSFIDLVTLMLTFFVLIFATQKPNDMAWQQTQKSFQMAFNGVGGQSNDQAPNKIRDEQQQTLAKQLEDDTIAGLDIEYLTGLLSKAWAQEPQLAQIPFNIVQKNASVHLSLPRTAWQDAVGINRRAELLAPLLNRMENNITIMAKSPQPETGLILAQTIAQALKQAGYQKNIVATAQFSPNDDFIDVVLTFNAH